MVPTLALFSLFVIARGSDESTIRPYRFTTDHAEEIGKSERTIQKLVSIGSQTAVACFEIQAQKVPDAQAVWERLEAPV